MEYLHLIEALEQNLGAMSFSDYPELLGQLERLKALVWTKTISHGAERCHQENGSKLLTMQEVADQLSIPKSRAYELARQGRFPITRVGKYIRVTQVALQEWIERETS